jgi:hypothetical protein
MGDGAELPVDCFVGGCQFLSCEHGVHERWKIVPFERHRFEIERIPRFKKRAFFLGRGLCRQAGVGPSTASKRFMVSGSRFLTVELILATLVRSYLSKADVSGFRSSHEKRTVCS